MCHLSLFELLFANIQIKFQISKLFATFSLKTLLIVPHSNLMPWLGEGSPGDVEPPLAREQLVGIFPVLQEIHECGELSRIFRADIGSLADKVLGVLDAPNLSVHGLTTEARVDDDRSHHKASRFQQHVAAIGHVHHVLRRGDILWVLAQFAKFAQFKVRRESNVIDCCVHGNAY